MRKGKSHNRSKWRRFLIFTGACLLLIGICAGLIYLFRDSIFSFMTSTAIGITQMFGWGLILLVLGILTLAVVIITSPILLARYWNKWIGAFLLVAAIWGILAFFPGRGYLADVSLGGRVGQSIIGPSVPIGILVVLALMIIGTFFVAPRGFAYSVAAAFSWIASRFKREPAPVSIPLPEPQIGLSRTAAAGEEKDLKATTFPRYNPPPPPKPAEVDRGSKSWLWKRLHPEAEPPVPGSTSASSVLLPAAPPVTISGAGLDTGEEPAVAESETPEKAAVGKAPDQAEKPAGAPGPASHSKDTKQVAQEVWKKYGEGDTQLTADGWKLPPVDILDSAPDVEFSPADNLKKAKLIEEALASYGVEGKVIQINVGPTVTQFGIEPGWDRKLKEVKEKDKNGDVQVRIEEVSKTRVKVDRITSLANDLALALAAPSLRIEAPVPGKSVVGIEVPNTTIGVVTLRGVVESNVFQKMQAKSKLAVGLGKGAGGESVVGDLTKMPHLLIAGATGSGKTVCIHAIICCFLLYNTPRDVRFIMIDPKRVELTSYNSLPHLATPVIVDTKKALGALRWLTQEMDKRYQTMAAARARNIEAYNKARPNEKLPYLVLVIDELADLMMTAGEEVEQHLCRLAQLARAVGIHLIVATQRPSVDVVTGLIKSNFPTRISFAVTSQVDSRTILDSGGAEKLLGKGDMLYMPTEASKPKRLQGCFLSDAEIERLVYFWNNQRKETASQLNMEDIMAAEVAKADRPPEDPLLEEARQLAREHGNVSASFLQRHLRIGYPRAARLMEQLGSEDEEPEEDDLEEEGPRSSRAL